MKLNLRRRRKCEIAKSPLNPMACMTDLHRCPHRHFPERSICIRCLDRSSKWTLQVYRHKRRILRRDSGEHRFSLALPYALELRHRSKILIGFSYKILFCPRLKSTSLSYLPRPLHSVPRLLPSSKAHPTPDHTATTIANPIMSTGRTARDLSTEGH